MQLIPAYKRARGSHNQVYIIAYMGKARDFKSHVTPAVFSFVATATYV